MGTHLQKCRILRLKTGNEDLDSGSVDFWPAGSGSVTFFYWTRILPVTTDILNYFHFEQIINQNQQIQA